MSTMRNIKGFSTLGIESSFTVLELHNFIVSVFFELIEMLFLSINHFFSPYIYRFED